MNKTSYQTFKGSPAEPEVTVPLKTQTSPYVITFRLKDYLQGTKKNTKVLPAYIKTPVKNVAFKGPPKKCVKTKSVCMYRELCALKRRTSLTMPNIF